MAKKSFRQRGADVGRGLARGFKGTLMAGGAGAATFFAHDIATQNITSVQDKPWAIPAGLLVVGHLMKQRQRLVVPGTAVCGAAGYALGNAINFMMKTKAAGKDAQGLVTREAQGVVTPETGDVPELQSGLEYFDPSNETQVFSEAMGL
jgi:hypothetical protein